MKKILGKHIKARIVHQQALGIRTNKTFRLRELVRKTLTQLAEQYDVSETEFLENLILSVDEGEDNWPEKVPLSLFKQKNSVGLDTVTEVISRSQFRVFTFCDPLKKEFSINVKDLVGQVQYKVEKVKPAYYLPPDLEYAISMNHVRYKCTEIMETNRDQLKFGEELDEEVTLSYKFDSDSPKDFDEIFISRRDAIAATKILNGKNLGDYLKYNDFRYLPVSGRDLSLSGSQSAVIFYLYEQTCRDTFSSFADFKQSPQGKKTKTNSGRSMKHLNAFKNFFSGNKLAVFNRITEAKDGKFKLKLDLKVE